MRRNTGEQIMPLPGNDNRKGKGDEKRNEKNPVAIFLFAVFVLLTNPASAVTTISEFSFGELTIPAVKVGKAWYEATLGIQDGEEIVFQLESASPISAPEFDSYAVYRSKQLLIPEFRVGDAIYEVSLELVSAKALLFDLVNAKNQSGDPGVPFADSVQAALGYSVLPDTRGGFNYEPVIINSAIGYDRQRSINVFEETLYPHLRSSTCLVCHNSELSSSSAAQAPIHTDVNVELAHDYALTRVNFADPENSKLVVRMSIDRHNCPMGDCQLAGEEMLEAVEAWKAGIADMLTETPRLVAESEIITEQQVEAWIEEDRAQLSTEDQGYIVYTSMHELHNEGLSADELNIVRVALSKALNSVARWAPEIVNPVDVNGLGLLYKFDIRDYWGWNKGVTRLLFGGSDDDLAFGNGKRDYRGNLVNSAVQTEVYNYADDVSWDPEFSLTILERVLHGNVEGAVTFGTIPPYIDGFRGVRSENDAGEYIELEDFEWVEAAQLIYTLTRPDVYNAIMMIPMYSNQLEDELGVDKSLGMDSYDYVISFDAITVDSRLLWRAETETGGWYWKTWDIFTGQLSGGNRSIFDVYAEGGDDIRFPWWANPIPKFVSPFGNFTDNSTWSFIASLAQPFGEPPEGCDPQPNYSGIEGFYNCRHYTGTGGLQQSASEIIWNIPNGLQAYMLTGAFNQRRVDAFVNIVRDPRVIPDAEDNIATQTGFTFDKRGGGIGGFFDPRLNVGSSCIGCHIDGMNRLNNDMRDWLDESPGRLPAGNYGVDPWINDESLVERVRELYPPSDIIRDYIEQGRKTFLGAMAIIKQGMMLGIDKNIYVEPVIWTVEYVQRQKYQYPQTTSN